MNNSDKGFTFDIETGINKKEIQTALSYGVVLKFSLVLDDLNNEWCVKVSSSTGSSGWLINSRDRIKRYSSLDTAIRQLAALAPDVPVSIHY